MFSLRPPELVSVFQTPKEYYRYCLFSDTAYDAGVMKDLLSSHVRKCAWIDALGRHVHIRTNALQEVKVLCEKNTQHDNPDFPINQNILEMIRVYKANDDILSDEEKTWKQSMSLFFKDDGLELLPIPVFTHVSPANTHHFFVHIVNHPLY